MAPKNLAYLLSLALDEANYFCDIIASDEQMFDHTKETFANNLSSIAALATDLLNSPLFKVSQHA